MVHFLYQTRGGKCEQTGCGPASVRDLTAEGFYYIIFARSSGHIFTCILTVAVRKGGMSMTMRIRAV